jgi:hypothetical protein
MHMKQIVRKLLVVITIWFLNPIIAMEGAPTQIPVEQSKRDIAAALALAKKQGRELHIMLGALPDEPHIKRLLSDEAARPVNQRPIRIFFSNNHQFVTQSSSAETPVLNGDFNNEKSWDVIVGSLGLVMKNDKSYQGFVDKVYFDCSTVKHTNLQIDIVHRLKCLLKPTGEIFIPEANLLSQVKFEYKGVERSVYNTLATDAKRHVPYFVGTGPDFGCLVKGVTTNRVEKGWNDKDGKLYDYDKWFCYNGTSIINDVFFSGQKALKYTIRPWIFTAHETIEGYPDIGLRYREEFVPKIEYYAKISIGKRDAERK